MPTTQRDKERKIERIKWAKRMLGGVCIGCGVDEPLVFHHINPETKIEEIWRIVEYNQEAFEKEVFKCVLLCRSCHFWFHLILNGEMVERRDFWDDEDLFWDDEDLDEL